MQCFEYSWGEAFLWPKCRPIFNLALAIRLNCTSRNVLLALPVIFTHSLSANVWNRENTSTLASLAEMFLVFRARSLIDSIQSELSELATNLRCLKLLSRGPWDVGCRNSISIYRWTVRHSPRPSRSGGDLLRLERKLDRGRLPAGLSGYG